MLINFNIGPLILVLLLSSCAKVATIDVKTPRDTKIYKIQPETNEKILINVEQIKSTFSRLSRTNKSLSSYIILGLENKKYKDKRIHLIKKQDGTLKITAKMYNKNNFIESPDFDQIISKIFEAQKQYKMNNFKRGHQIIDQLIELYPNFSTLYEIKGHAYLKEKEYVKALNFFKLALSYSPKNKDLEKIINFTYKIIESI